MSKQLNSIINKLPHATVNNEAEKLAKSQNINSEKKIKKDHPSRRMLRIVAPVPESLKMDMKRYILDHPGETEKSLILKGLRAIGFHIDEEYIIDLRKNK